MIDSHRKPNNALNDLNWIPDFSQPLAVLRALLVSVAIALLLTLLRYGLGGWEHGVFGPFALLSAWICCLSLIGLQLVRTYGSGLPIWLSATLAFCWMLASAALCSLAPFWLGIQLAFLSYDSMFETVAETMLITFIVGSVVLRAVFAHHEIRKNEKRLLDAKYDALQARIRPHFLFNSLNSLAELITIDAARAENAVLDLSDLYRATLSDQAPVRVEQELALCEKYLCVEKLRMEDRLSWQFDVDEEAKGWLIPALSLQPLLENAVLHGLQPLPEGGQIEMSLKVDGNKLMLRIKNPVGANKDTTSRGTGTALKNVHARLSAYYSGSIVFDARQVDDQYLVSLSISNSAARL